MSTIGLVLALLGTAVAFLAGRVTRRDSNAGPPPSRRPTSILVERVEPSFRPIRICGRCFRKIVKRREGDEMVVRIEGQTILYLHDTCADAAGEPLPRITSRRA